MIGRIEIENYKSIEKLSLDLGRVTVLIGANGSGKSNILEAIALCSAAAANKLDNEFLFSRGIRVSDDPRHMRSVFNESESEEGINLIFEGESKNQKLNEIGILYTCQLDNDNLPYSKWRNTVVDYIVQKSVNNAIAEMILEPPEDADTHPKSVDWFNAVRAAMEATENHYYSSVAADAKDHGIEDFLIFGPENSPMRSFETEGQVQPLGTRGEGLFKLLTVLAREENRDRLNEIQERLQLLDWFGDFQIGGNVALGERTLRIRDQYLDGDLAYFTQRNANEGFLFLLFYFTLFVAKETPRFFAIDNIDTSLNPKLCAELLRQLTQLAEKYDKQVILTTHNPAVLDGLNLHDENQKLYVVERDLDGRTQARRVPPPRAPEKHEEPVPLSEAFLRGYIGGLPKNF